MMAQERENYLKEGVLFSLCSMFVYLEDFFVSSNVAKSLKINSRSRAVCRIYMPENQTLGCV